MITITISANGNRLGQIEVDPPAPPRISDGLDWLDTSRAVISRRGGGLITLAEDPVEWALSIPDEYPSRQLDVAISKSLAPEPGAAAPTSPQFPPTQPLPGPQAPPSQQFPSNQPLPGPQSPPRQPSQQYPAGAQYPPPPPYPPASPYQTGPQYPPYPPQQPSQAPGTGSFPNYPAAGQATFVQEPAGARRARFAQQFQLSGWWRRVGAAVIDGLVVSVPTTLVRLLLAPNGSNATSLGLAELFGFVLFCAYYMLTMSRAGVHNGQSFGKQALEIRVVRDDGREVGAGFALLREFVCKSLLSAVTVGIYGLLDSLWPLADGSRRALHDKLVQTHVVREWVSPAQHAREYQPYNIGAASTPPTNVALIVGFIALVVLVALIFIALIIAAIHAANNSGGVFTITSYST